MDAIVVAVWLLCPFSHPPMLRTQATTTLYTTSCWSRTQRLPPFLQSVVDHLITSGLLSEAQRPNHCLVSVVLRTCLLAVYRFP